MREIKFRAWDRQNGCWIDETDFFIDPDGEVEVFDAPTESWLIGGPITLSQFTGLHDKNGKEIYEGDIIEHHSALVPREANPNIRQTVTWNVWHWDGIRNWKGSEVIGNIYEGTK